MATKSMYAPEGWSQRNQRRSQMFRDQHGRRYHAIIETKTGHPTGPIEPRFLAPLSTPQMYIELSKDPERPYDLSINYRQWEQDLRTAHTDWQRRGEKIARLVFGERYDPNAAFTRQVLEELGPPPQHVEPVIAARQGNKYVLGLTDRVDVRLYAMLQEDVATQTTPAEPDFSDVVESLDDEDDDPVLEAMQTSADAATEARKKKDRDRKALKREQERMAAEAAHAAQAADAA